MEFTSAELEALKTEYAAGATQAQFDWWIADCKRRDLVPVRDVILQTRKSMEWDPELGARVAKTKAITITSIGALLKIAQRSGQYAGPLPAKWVYLDSEGNPTIESDIPLPDPGNQELPRQPWAAKSPVQRKDFAQPTVAVARWWAYVQTYKDKSSGNERPNSVWNTRGPEQLSKCSLAASIRLAFPEEAGGLYITEEMDNLDRENHVAATPAPIEPIVAAPKAPTVPKVDHTPAVATDAPRPGADKVVEVLQPRIEDVILDRPATPPPVQKMDTPEKPKKLTAKEKTTAALDAEHASMMSAIDAERAKDADPDRRLPTPEERTANSAAIRKIIGLGLSVSEKNLLQTYVEEGHPLVEKLQSDWNRVLSKLEAAGTKEAVLALVTPEPEPEF